VVRNTVSDSMVLPPGEFNGINTRPLPVYSESFMAIRLTLFRNVADSYAYKQTFITTLQNVIVYFTDTLIALTYLLRQLKTNK